MGILPPEAAKVILIGVIVIGSTYPACSISHPKVLPASSVNRILPLLPEVEQKEDVLDPMLEENTNRPVGDVVNYIKATEFALDRMNYLPLCNRLLKETHAILMQGVRGQEKNPGEFRISQNWIGAQGSSIKNARYIPPNPQDMLEAMSDLEKYMNEEDFDNLIYFY